MLQASMHRATSARPRQGQRVHGPRPRHQPTSNRRRASPEQQGRRSFLQRARHCSRTPDAIRQRAERARREQNWFHLARLGSRSSRRKLPRILLALYDPSLRSRAQPTTVQQEQGSRARQYTIRSLQQHQRPIQRAGFPPPRCWFVGLRSPAQGIAGG